jgi:uncharacterized protein YgiM (DUF1202 family)
MTNTRLVLPLGFVVAVATSAVSHAQAPVDQPRREPPAASQPAEGGRRVVVTAATAPAHNCAAATCRVVADLEKGAIVSVLKTDGDWHQVMVRTAANAMTTGWVRATQVAATADVTTRITGTERSDGVFRPAQPDPAAPDAAPDARGCLTCLATREPTPDEWNAALADAATRKGTTDPRTVRPGLADGRTTDERMRDLFAERYDPELKRLAGIAGAVDAGLNSYLASCFQRFASIPVEGAAPRVTAVDEILKAARSSPGAARFALWAGTAAFQWNPTWAPQANDNSAQPSCERLWEDVRGRADALKVELEFLERDAREHDIYPGIVREMLAARGLAEGAAPSPSAPATDIR